VKLDIQELIDAKVISAEIAESIRTYYHRKEQSTPNRLILVFGILGALLVGLGIILIIAHNWENLSKGFKTVLAFIPLLIGQFAIAYSIFKRSGSNTWREASACFLIFAIGASISLISQIYNIEGNLSSFLLTWSLLVLPIVYIAGSSIASLMYLILITYFSIESRYSSFSHSFNYTYWILFLAGFPYIFVLFKKRVQTNFINFHSFIIPISLSIAVGSLPGEFPHLLSIVFISLFAFFYILGYLYKRPEHLDLSNGFILFGSLATMLVLFIASFQTVSWNEAVFQSNTFYFSLMFFVLAFVTLSYYLRDKLASVIDHIQPMMPVFIIYTLIFILGQFYPSAAQTLINFLILMLGVLTIRQGANLNHLGVMNYGLIIISILVACRFFDTDLSFVWRGIIFVSLGLGFFATNYWMIKKRKENG
jgi:uncharacterized membrane protein